MTVKKDKSRKINEDEDLLNKKRQKEYKKKKNYSWEDQDESYDDTYDDVYDDSYLDYLYDDDEDDLHQITDIHEWIKNN